MVDAQQIQKEKGKASRVNKQEVGSAKAKLTISKTHGLEKVSKGTVGKQKDNTKAAKETKARAKARAESAGYVESKAI